MTHPVGQDFLQKFIDAYYMKQPRWIRNAVFLLFSGLLAFIVYRTVAGQHTVAGQILQRHGEGYTPARLHEVQLGDRLFGTNSKGFYYLVLSAGDYYAALLKGELELQVSHEETIFEPRKVPFGRLKGQLAAIRLGDAPGAAPAGPPPAEIGWSPLHLVAPPLWAQAGGPGDRLFVRGIRLSPRARLRQVSLALEEGSVTRRLMSARTRTEAGVVPVIPGEAISFEPEYYLAWDADRGVPARIALSGGPGGLKGLLGGYDERFTLPAAPEPGRPFPVTGDRGSEISLVRMLPYNVILFDKDDLAPTRDSLRAELVASGFHVVVGPSPLGTRGQTNALFGGQSVPFAAMQRIIRIATGRGVTFKTIEYRRALRSGNPLEVQLGGSAAFNTRPPIPPASIRALLDAATDERFADLVRRLRS